MRRVDSDSTGGEQPVRLRIEIPPTTPPGPRAGSTSTARTPLAGTPIGSSRTPIIAVCTVLAAVFFVVACAAVGSSLIRTLVPWAQDSSDP